MLEEELNAFQGQAFWLIRFALFQKHRKRSMSASQNLCTANVSPLHETRLACIVGTFYRATYRAC